MKKIILTLILSFAIISCETPSQANSDFPLVVDSSKYEEIANELTDAVNAQDVDLAMSYFSDDAVWAFPNGVQIQGKEALSQSYMQSFFTRNSFRFFRARLFFRRMASLLHASFLSDLVSPKFPRDDICLSHFHSKFGSLVCWTSPMEKTKW